MKKIFLLRHAHSPLNHSSDFDRPLSQEGIDKCKSVAKILRGFELDIIFSSSALRTRQTVENILTSLNKPIKVEYLDFLYKANAHQFLEFIEEKENLYNNILFVGHNPVVSELPSLIDTDLTNSNFFFEIQKGFFPASLAEFTNKKLTSFWQ